MLWVDPTDKQRWNHQSGLWTIPNSVWCAGFSERVSTKNVFFFNNEGQNQTRTCHDIVSGEWVQRVPEKKVTNPVGFFFVAPHRALSQLACHSEQERLPRSVPGGTNKLAAGLLDLLDLLSFQNQLKSCAKVRNAKLLPTQTMDSLKWINQALNHGFSADGFSPDSPQPL